MVINLVNLKETCYLQTMPRITDARERAIDTAVRLFRIQGYTATGLIQILKESGAPKGSFYFHFPRGKKQLAEEAIDLYVAKRIELLLAISAKTAGNARHFVDLIFETFAADMVASDFKYGCLMQNLANELPTLDAELTSRVARGFVVGTEIVSQHFQACGFDPARASSSANALVAALEGARTIARLERSPDIFDALAKVSTRGWAAPEDDDGNVDVSPIDAGKQLQAES